MESCIQLREAHTNLCRSDSVFTDEPGVSSMSLFGETHQREECDEDVLATHEYALIPRSDRRVIVKIPALSLHKTEGQERGARSEN